MKITTFSLIDTSPYITESDSVKKIWKNPFGYIKSLVVPRAFSNALGRNGPIWVESLFMVQIARCFFMVCRPYFAVHTVFTSVTTFYSCHGYPLH